MTSPKAWQIIADKLKSSNVSRPPPLLLDLNQTNTLTQVQELHCNDSSSCAQLTLWLQVKVISQQELLFAKEKGAIIIDIRPSGEYEEGHVEDSLNVALYRLITGTHKRKKASWFCLHALDVPLV